MVWTTNPEIAVAVEPPWAVSGEAPCSAGEPAECARFDEQSRSPEIPWTPIYRANGILISG